jgi:D-aspartate ligase
MEDGVRSLRAYVLGGYEAGLAVVRSLGAAGVPVISVWTSKAETARRSRHVSLSVRAPHPWQEPDEYVELLLDLSLRVGPGLLLPTTDEAVSTVARTKDRLQARHLVACPQWPVVQRFLDKQATYELAERLAVPLPKTLLPASEEELKRMIPELPFPCIVKPRLSHLYRDAFGVKMTKVSDRAELLSAWRRSRRVGIGTVIQEFIPGPETAGVNYNGYMVDGKPRVEVTARKVRMSPPELGYPTVVVSSDVQGVLEPARRLLRGMELNGFANVEFKYDARDDMYKLMEVNGRPNMSGMLSVRCGVDFPLMTYRHLCFGQLPESNGSYERGVYWINEPADLSEGASRLRVGSCSARGFVEPYVRPHVLAMFSLDDPAPFAVRALAKLRSSLTR